MSKEIFIYFSVALIGYGVDISIYLMLLELNFDVYISFILALAIGLSVNVVLLRRFFKKGRFGILKDIWLTLVANGLVLVFGFGLYAGLMTFFEIGPLISKLVSNAVTFALNFILRKKIF
jgi:putative flippase GtrA